MPGNKKAHFLLILSLSVLMSIAVRPAHAQVGITVVEMMLLPEFCQSAIAGSSYAASLPFEYRSRKGVASPQGGDGATGVGIPGGHHFCMGRVLMNRAGRGGKADAYAAAIPEFMYSYRMLELDSPSYSHVSSYLGKALYRSGKRNDGMKVWAEAISVQPQGRESYLAMAEALLSERRPQEALEILKRFDQVKDVEYADAEHFMAQAYFELKRYDEAKLHLDKAYSLGYPFFGLRDKLKRLGKY